MRPCFRLDADQTLTQCSALWRIEISTGQSSFVDKLKNCEQSRSIRFPFFSFFCLPSFYFLLEINFVSLAEDSRRLTRFRVCFVIGSFRWKSKLECRLLNDRNLLPLESGRNNM